MLKPPGPTLHKTTRPEMTSLFGEAKLALEEMPKAISPFGGLASLIPVLGQIGYARQVRQHLPSAVRRTATTSNAIPLAHSLNRSESPLALWRDYSGRARVEQRNEELKHDLAADGFCRNPALPRSRCSWRRCSPSTC
jgi:hypothetical protein